MHKKHIAVIGLGYVGLPLAIEFGKKFPTIGFDINKVRIQELRNGLDRTREVEQEELGEANGLSFSSQASELSAANIYIVTVPTPIDKHNRPDLAPLEQASTLVGSQLKANDLVIYESTVYPGATEEFCVPILEQVSGLKLNDDFHVGYSPERVNPGDKKHRICSIVKVTSGSTEQAAESVDELYKSIIKAGTHKAESIKIAEAAKVIENTQRDVNIALMNELSMIFNRLDIETESVLNAAGSKWNFLNFRPGLVGGHCIGVDPYYLTHKAQELGYHPEIVLAGRRINDQMGEYVASQMVKAMLNKGIAISGARVLVMGLTFKENCPDLRNTRVIDVIKELSEYHVAIDVYDPWVDAKSAQAAYGISMVTRPQKGSYDGIIVAVPHQEFSNMGHEHISSLGNVKHVLYDLKSLFPLNASDLRL